MERRASEIALPSRAPPRRRTPSQTSAAAAAAAAPEREASRNERRSTRAGTHQAGLPRRATAVGNDGQRYDGRPDANLPR